MARPKRGNYATGAAGQAKYVAALKKHLANVAKAKEARKITSTKKNIEKQKTAAKKTTSTKVKELAKKTTTTAKKTTAKKPVASKTVAKTTATKTPVTKTVTRTKAKTTPKKPVANKPAGKVPAKKPLISSKNKLRIKKAATTARKTTVKTAKTVGKKIGEAKTTVKKVLNKKSPVRKPTTTGQKLASKANKAVKSGIKQTGKNLLKIGKGIAKDPKSLLKGAKGAGLSYLAERATTGLVNRAFKPKGMSQSEYAKKLSEMRGKRNIVKSVKNIASKIRGKSNTQSSTTKNINKQKKTNNTGLKTKKTQYSSKDARKKQNFGAATGTKKADKRFGTFRESPTANRNLQLERQKGNTETYSRKLSTKAKNQKSTSTTTTKSAKPGSARAKMRAKNEARFGKARVDKLRSKNADFQAMKKKKMTKAEFIRRYPKSITAQRAKGLR